MGGTFSRLFPFPFSFSYGHHVGDEVLRHISRVIRDVFQEIGLVCRYGGEESCVAVPQIDVTQAIALAEQTLVAISKIRMLDPANLRLTASVGVSKLQFDAVDTQELINQADTCLYIAKREE